MSWKRQKILIRLGRGVVELQTATVKADVCRGVAVHRRMMGDPLLLHAPIVADGWMVTHVNSGFAICGPWPTKAKALTKARRALTIQSDWSFTDTRIIRGWSKRKCGLLWGLCRRPMEPPWRLPSVQSEP